MFDSDYAKYSVYSLCGLRPFLGQGAANAAEVLGTLLETCSDRQLNAVLASIYEAHQETIQELDSASEWRIPVDPKVMEAE